MTQYPGKGGHVGGKGERRMPRRDLKTRIDELKERRARVDAELERLRRQASARERKRDTRRKIVAGATVLAAAAENRKVESWFRKLLEQRVRKPDDRRLFNLDAEMEDAGDRRLERKRP